MAGLRSPLAPWVGGAASTPAVSSGGPRSLLAFWLGGASSTPFVSSGGFRSPFAFWLGGASAVPGEPVEPTPEVQALGGGGYNPSQGNFGYPLDRRPDEADAGAADGRLQSPAIGPHSPSLEVSPLGANALQSLSIDALLDGWERQSHERRLAELRSTGKRLHLPASDVQLLDDDALAILLLLS
jgi:hypothetical protein